MNSKIFLNNILLIIVNSIFKRRVDVFQRGSRLLLCFLNVTLNARTNAMFQVRSTLMQLNWARFNQGILQPMLSRKIDIHIFFDLQWSNCSWLGSNQKSLTQQCFFIGTSNYWKSLPISAFPRSSNSQLFKFNKVNLIQIPSVTLT